MLESLCLQLNFCQDITRQGGRQFHLLDGSELSEEFEIEVVKLERSLIEQEITFGGSINLATCTLD